MVRYSVSFRIRHEREDGKVLCFGSDSKDFISLGDSLSFLNENYNDAAQRFNREGCLFLWSIFDFETGELFTGNLEVEYMKTFIDSVTSIDLSQYKK